MIARRSFLTGLVSLIAAPAIVHAGNLMPVKALRPLLTTMPDLLDAQRMINYRHSAWIAACAQQIIDLIPAHYDTRLA